MAQGPVRPGDDQLPNLSPHSPQRRLLLRGGGRPGHSLRYYHSHQFRDGNILESAADVAGQSGHAIVGHAGNERQITARDRRRAHYWSVLEWLAFGGKFEKFMG